MTTTPDDPYLDTHRTRHNGVPVTHEDTESITSPTLDAEHVTDRTTTSTITTTTEGTP